MVTGCLVQPVVSCLPGMILYNEEATLEKRQALDRFFAAIERRAFRMAEVATGNRDDALDILQESMITVAQKYSRRPESEWTPLFYRILQNRINDWYRQHYRRSRLFGWISQDNEIDDPVENQPVRMAEEPDSLTQTGETLTALELAIQKLPLRQQQAIMLRIWEGFDVAQTANIMSCSQGSVKTHFSRAVHTLRDQLGEHWP